MAVSWLVLGSVVLIPIAAILGGVAIITVIVRAISGGSRGNSAANAEEARIMQEIHRGLSKMEKRLDNLEAILGTREEKAEGPKHSV